VEAAAREQEAAAREQEAAALLAAAQNRAGALETLLSARDRMLESRTREVAAARGKIDQLTVQQKRLAADFENFRRRARREAEDTRKFATERLVKDLLPVLDNLARALGAAEEESPLRTGVGMVRKQLLDTLGRYGLAGFESEEHPFDPTRHEAISLVEREGVPDGTVVDVFQDGYLMHERLIRPAMVIVSRQPSRAPAAPAAPKQARPSRPPQSSSPLPASNARQEDPAHVPASPADASAEAEATKAKPPGPQLGGPEGVKGGVRRPGSGVGAGLKPRRHATGPPTSAASPPIAGASGTPASSPPTSARAPAPAGDRDRPSAPPASASPAPRGTEDPAPDDSQSMAGITVVRAAKELLDRLGQSSGVLVAAVRVPSPGARSGLQGGDVVTAVGNRPVTCPRDFVRAVRLALRGQKALRFRYVRGEGAPDGGPDA